jgi:hypothetical protein
MANPPLAEEEVTGEANGLIQRCPEATCGALMQKDSGCDAVKCPKCHIRICIHCKQRLNEATYGTDLRAHVCNKQKAIDQNLARRIAQQQAMAEGGGTYVIVETPEGTPVKVPFEETDTVKSLQDKIAQRTGIAVAQQKLMYAGKPIAPATVLSSLKVRKGSCLTLTTGVIGGK